MFLNLSEYGWSEILNIPSDSLHSLLPATHGKHMVNWSSGFMASQSAVVNGFSLDQSAGLYGNAIKSLLRSKF